MTIKFKLYAWVLALAVAAGVVGAAPTAFAHPAGNAQEQDHDYSTSKYYQQGLREGRDDMAHNRDHYKKHHFKRDEDRRAYEEGYQHGHEHHEGDHQ